MEYSVVKREINLGLMNQWFNIWEPKHDRELAFVFEDDVTVSSLFFQWAAKAAASYYNGPQKSIHRKFLNLIQRSKFSKSYDVHLSSFIEDYSGDIILSGICLQRQAVDPTHYPKFLRVKNNFRPYLHRCIFISAFYIYSHVLY